MTTPRIIELKHPSGARAEIYLYGATVTGFYTAKEPSRNVLFISKNSVMDGTKAIRGGIPLVFPVFGPHEGFPQHGFARIMNWTLSLLDQTIGDTNSPTIATFALQANDDSKALWPYEFELRYEIKLFADTMITTLHVINPSSNEISFQALLHTYLTVEDVRDRGCVVEGLQGVEYFNKLTQTSQTEENDVISFDQETDRVYKNTPDKIIVRLGGENAAKRYVITIEKEGLLHHGTHQEKQLSDAVVWNPWINKSKAMVDFGDEEYITMVCVEPGRVSEKQMVGPGQHYTLQQTLHVSSL